VTRVGVHGDPPQGNANYAWLQHMLYHLKPTGRAGIVLANGSMSSSQNNEGQFVPQWLMLMLLR
jgi:type I restriction enzyme M protein